MKMLQIPLTSSDILLITREKREILRDQLIRIRKFNSCALRRAESNPAKIKVFLAKNARKDKYLSIFPGILIIEIPACRFNY